MSSTNEQNNSLLDPSTFVFPKPLNSTTVTIEFCDREINSPSGLTRIQQEYRARLHRATWVQTELFLTFTPPTIRSITLIPLNTDETAGRFRVWLSVPGSEQAQLMWDRKVEGGFPELKVLKQRIRDVLQPGKSLGHSDKA